MAGLTAWQRLLDFVDDVRLNVLRRPLRMLLLGIGTALAVAIYAGSTLIASASATAVNEVFDELAATRLQVDLPIDSRRNPEPDEHDIAAIRDLPDVVDAATIWSDGDASLISLRRPWLRIDRLVPVYSYWGSTDVIGLSVDGTTPDESVASTEVLIGAGLRGRLGLDVGDDVELDGRPTRIVGVITESPQLSDLLLGVVEFIPDPSLPPPKKGKLFVQVRVGSAERTGDILPWILIPGAPEVVLVRYPPEATRLRNAVVTKVDALAATVAVAILVATSLGVAAAAVGSIVERYRDIGLRRALGASRRGIAFMVAGELAAIALLSAGLGWAVGVIGARVYDAVNGLPFVYPTVPVALGVAAAFVANLFAAVPAAFKAARIEPVDALRSV